MPATPSAVPLTALHRVVVGTAGYIDHGKMQLVKALLASGTVRAGDVLDLLPSRQSVRVRSIPVHNRPREQAVAGERTSLQLTGTRRWLARAVYERGVARAQGVLKEYFQKDRIAQGIPKAEAGKRIRPAGPAHGAHAYFGWLREQNPPADELRSALATEPRLFAGLARRLRKNRMVNEGA